MFLRSDYDLMLDNELKLAAQYQKTADGYAARANEEPDAWYKEQYQNEISSYQRKADEHRAQAEYWMTVISDLEEVNNAADVARQ